MQNLKEEPGKKRKKRKEKHTERVSIPLRLGMDGERNWEITYFIIQDRHEGVPARPQWWLSPTCSGCKSSDLADDISERPYPHNPLKEGYLAMPHGRDLFLRDTSWAKLPRSYSRQGVVPYEKARWGTYQAEATASLDQFCGEGEPRLYMQSPEETFVRQTGHSEGKRIEAKFSNGRKTGPPSSRL